MESLVNNLAVTFDKTADMPETIPINPNDKRIIGLLLLFF